MLLNLQAFDVYVRHGQGEEEDDGQSSGRGLDHWRTANRMPQQQEHGQRPNDSQHQHDVPIDPMHHTPPVPNHRYELEADQERGRQDGGEVHDEADTADGDLLIKVALPREGAVGGAEAGPAEDGVDGEVHEAGEGEAGEGAGELEEEEEAAAAAEAEGVVDVGARPGYEGVGWGAVDGDDGHGGGLETKLGYVCVRV